MAEMTIKEILHLAELSRLELTPEEVLRCREEIPAIVAFVSKLQEVKTEGVAPMVGATSSDAVLREDEPTVCGEEIRTACLAAFPERVGDLLRVKAVFGGDRKKL